MTISPSRLMMTTETSIGIVPIGIATRKSFAEQQQQRGIVCGLINWIYLQLFGHYEEIQIQESRVEVSKDSLARFMLKSRWKRIENTQDLPETVAKILNKQAHATSDIEFKKYVICL